MSLPEELPEWVAAIFEALGDPTRMRIVALLDDGPMTIGELTKALGIRQSLVSFHVKRLRKAKLVSPEHLGDRQSPYSLSRMSLRAALKLLGAFSQDRPRRLVR